MTGVGRTYTFEVRGKWHAVQASPVLVETAPEQLSGTFTFFFRSFFFRDLRMVLDFFPTVVLRVRILRWNEKGKKIIR